MTRKKKALRALIWSAILLAVLISVGISYEKRSFRNLTVEEMVDATHDDLLISYKGVTIHWGSAWVPGNYAGLFTAPKRSWYFGKIDPELEPIVITVPEEVVLKVYPYDASEKSVLLEFQRYKGIKRTYLLKGFGNFQKHCAVLYEMTGNAVFLTEEASESA